MKLTQIYGECEAIVQFFCGQSHEFVRIILNFRLKDVDELSILVMPSHLSNLSQKKTYLRSAVHFGSFRILNMNVRELHSALVSIFVSTEMNLLIINILHLLPFNKLNCNNLILRENITPVI